MAQKLEVPERHRESSSMHTQATTISHKKVHRERIASIGKSSATSKVLRLSGKRNDRAISERETSALATLSEAVDTYRDQLNSALARAADILESIRVLRK